MSYTREILFSFKGVHWRWKGAKHKEKIMSIEIEQPFMHQQMSFEGDDPGDVEIRPAIGDTVTMLVGIREVNFKVVSYTHNAIDLVPSD